jgi:RimJ/RimL family protein N-acetyltransferase
MTGFVLAQNQPMLRLAAKLGFEIKRDPEDFTVHVCRLALGERA